MKQRGEDPSTVMRMPDPGKQPPMREGSRDKTTGPIPQGIVQKSTPVSDKMKTRSSNYISGANQKDNLKTGTGFHKEKNARIDEIVVKSGPIGTNSTSSGSQGQDQKPLTNVVGPPKQTSSAPLSVYQEVPIKTEIVVEQQCELIPEDPTSHRYTDITQFKAPEDLEGDDLHHQNSTANLNPNSDMMVHLTQMLQQGMCIAEVASRMNIPLDEQTKELLTTLKHQLDLAAALSKQSAIHQSSIVPDQPVVGKTCEYSDTGYGENSYRSNHRDVNKSSVKCLDNSNVMGADIQSHGISTIDYNSKDLVFSRDQGDGSFYVNSRDSSTVQYDKTQVDSLGERHLALDNVMDKTIAGTRDIGYSSDIHELGRDLSVDAGSHDPSYVSRYGDDRTIGVQKQYSYGPESYGDGESAKRHHRNSALLGFSGSNSGAQSLLVSPPFRKSVDVTGPNSSSKPGFGRQMSEEGAFNRGLNCVGGQYGRTGSQPGPRPLMAFETGRARGHGDFNRGQYREKW